MRLDDLADDESFRLVGANQAASSLLGVDLTPATGRSIRQVFPTAGVDFTKVCADVVRSGTVRALSVPAPTHANAAIEGTLATTAVPLIDQSVALVLEPGMLPDAQGKAIRRMNAFLREIVDHMPATVFVKDARELRFELVNRRGVSLFGLPREDLIGKTDYDIFPREQAEFFQAKDRAVLETLTLHEIAEEPIDTAQGRRWLFTRKIPILDEEGTRHLLGISLDITDRRAAEAALRLAHEEQKRQAAIIERLAITDELTGLHNRRGFSTLAEQHERVAVRGGRSFAILFADVDGLKSINDAMGHEVGDSALRTIAGALRGSVRGADIVGRLGGDEFVILLDDANHETVEEVSARIRQGLAEAIDERTGPLSISIGASFHTREQPRSIAELLAEADRQMYAEKRKRS